MSPFQANSIGCSDLSHVAQFGVQIAQKPLIFAAFRVFHREIRSVFHTFCVKKTSPSRMRRGSSPVKSTMAEGWPVLGPLSARPSSLFCNSRAKYFGSEIGGSPLRFALTDLYCALRVLEAKECRNQRKRKWKTLVS